MKKRLKIIIAVVIILSFMFFIVKYKNNAKLKIEYSKVASMQLETGMEININENKKKVYTLNQEEINIMVDIINSLTYTKETCDGLPKYYIKYNTGNEKEVETYGIEEYDSGYHIKFSGKGEARLSETQNAELRKIIYKYFN